MTYTVLVSNAGPGAAAGVHHTNQLPADTRFVSVTAAGSCTATDVSITDLGELAAGASATVEIVVTARRAGTIVNTAEVRSLSQAANIANNTDSETTTVFR